MNAVFVIVILLSVAMASVVVIAAVTGFWRRRDPLPADMLDGEKPRDGGSRGRYIGTFTLDREKPVTADGFLQGGPGVFYVDDRGINFLVDHSLNPVHLPFARVRGAALATHRVGRDDAVPGLAVEWDFTTGRVQSSFVLDDPALHESFVSRILAAKGGIRENG